MKKKKTKLTVCHRDAGLMGELIKSEIDILVTRSLATARTQALVLLPSSYKQSLSRLHL
jgi:hypothetical protein